MLSGASEVLYNALGGKVFLKSVNVAIPSSWRDAKCAPGSGAAPGGQRIGLPKGETPYRRADLRVTGPHPIHGETPFTQQSRGCGEPGDFISFPFQFLTKLDNSSSAKLMASEWAKLRYGIFDEFGFARDRFYPNFFIHKGKSLPTAASNLPLKGEWVNR